MELYGWQQCQRKPVRCTGTFNLLPLSWDTISCIYSQVLKLVSKSPSSGRLVLCLAFRGTTVKLDFGDVKVAGVVCILSLGVGLGTLFIYRLYNQYIKPFLENQCAEPDSPCPSESNSLVDSSDSGVDGAMGNNSSGPSAAVFYSPQYGVALGGKGLSPRQQLRAVAETDAVRLRRMGTRGKPMRRLAVDRDKKSQPGSSADLSPSFYEPNIRDSYYSTAESGFETLPEGNEDEEEVEGEAQELSHSLKENFSASSLKERNDRYFPAVSVDCSSSSPSGDKTVVSVPLLEESEGRRGSAARLSALTQPDTLSSPKSSPMHRGGPPPDAHHLSARRHAEDYDYDDPSLDCSESIRSFNSSGEEWSWEEEERDASTLPLAHAAMSDRQFRQSLMQRIQEWSSFAEEFGKSRSPTPDCIGSPIPGQRWMRRSQSLDRHLGEPLYVGDVVSPAPAAEGEDCTIRNLESLETEFHHIQGEFESITSKLHELIERGAVEDEGEGPSSHQPLTKGNLARLRQHHHLDPASNHQRSSNNSSPSYSPHHHPRPPGPLHHHHRHRTKWERMPSVARSDSSRSSRASSTDYSWDCGEVGGTVEGDGGRRRDQNVPPMPPVHRLAGSDGDHAGLGLGEDKDAKCESHVTNVGEPVSIAVYAEQEWKGDTPKAKTIKQGYLSIPALFGCQHVRRVRGDNYCGLRSVLFQVLVGGHQCTQRWPGLIAIVDRFNALNTDSASGLNHWTFAGRLAWDGEEDKFLRITRCVLSLYAMVDQISGLSCGEERLSRTLSLLNGDERFDTELMEGLKLLMLCGANDLQQEMAAGGDVPTFAWLLFARDTSPDVPTFVQNHLNCVGDSAGIDQVEMCLLGHCLGVKVRVARLDHHGQQEFDCSFPDEGPEDWPTVCLLAEDDRHYNVPVV